MNSISGKEFASEQLQLSDGMQRLFCLYSVIRIDRLFVFKQENAMQHVWPIIAVHDVVRSSRWYMKLLDAGENHPGSTVFNQIINPDGPVLLCLHHWGPSGPKGNHVWPSLADPGGGADNGILLWFIIDNFDVAWQRAQSPDVSIVESPNTDNGTGCRAFMARDPDGYYVVINESPESQN